jgi:hypothetical protein
VTQPILGSKWMDMLLHEIGLLRKARQGPILAGLGHRSDATERLLISVLQSSTREGPLRIIEPPFLAADRSAVDDLCC